MILKNANAFINGKFEIANIEIYDNKIVSLAAVPDDNAVDCEGKYVIPGLVDIHTHGCMGHDFSSCSAEDIADMQAYYLKNGITSILATTVSLSDDAIIKAVSNIKTAASKDTTGAKIRGINLEGPYLSPKKCGAHDSSLLKEPDADFINSLGDFIKIVNAAPEYNNTGDLIRRFKGKVSIAHTDCDYSTAMKAIDLGADHITHIFNAMNGLHHRKPGVIGAFFDSNAIAEIICDSIHLDSAILRMMFGAKSDNLAIISDSMSATGLFDGEYLLGNLKVYVKDAVATLADGTLAGSAMNIYDMMKNLIRIGVPKEKAIKSATQIPAQSAGLAGIGMLAPDYDADILIVNEDFSIYKIISGGKILT